MGNLWGTDPSNPNLVRLVSILSKTAGERVLCRSHFRQVKSGSCESFAREVALGSSVPAPHEDHRTSRPDRRTLLRRREHEFGAQCFSAADIERLREHNHSRRRRRRRAASKTRNRPTFPPTIARLVERLIARRDPPPLNTSRAMQGTSKTE